MVYSTLEVQKALKTKGFNVTLDGIMGPETEAAISQFKLHNGLRPRPYIGPLTAKLLLGDDQQELDIDVQFPPWLNELGRYIDVHEVRDRTKLMKWLRSDGGTLGDPSKLPWCGDAMHTAIRLTLPKEPFPGNLGKNPYWARNWLLFGKKTPIALGALVIASRGKGGHIAAVVGYDPRAKRVRVRGGNQSNTINDTWLAEPRVLGYRAPVTWNKPLPPVPIMNSKGQVVSYNEA